MKFLIAIIALALTVHPALAKSKAARTARKPASVDCANLPPAQQQVLKALARYASTGADVDAVFFVGSAAQYTADVQAWAPKNDPDFGNTWDIGPESNTPYLCTSNAWEKISKEVEKCNRTAIKMTLMFSAVYPLDGADAEDLGDDQDKAEKKCAAVVKEIQKTDASFFKAHPIHWWNHN